MKVYEIPEVEVRTIATEAIMDYEWETSELV